MIKITVDKDWIKAQRKFAIAAATLPRVIKNMGRREAEFYRDRIVEGLRNEAPAGKPYKVKMNPWTEATRNYLGLGSSKLLIQNADLIRSIEVVERRGGFFVGVPPGAVNSRGQSLVKIAAVQEEGSKLIKMRLTPKMVKLIAMIAKKLNREPPPARKSKKGFVFVQIPARPFIGPVVKKYGWEGSQRVRMRLWLADMAQTLFW